MSSKLTRAVAVAAVAAAFAVAPSGAAAAPAQPASGLWLSQIPCVNTPLEYYDPITNEFECTGVSNWTGTWNGQCFYRAKGVVDPSTGDSHGTIEEVVWAVTEDGHKGTLRWYEEFNNKGFVGTTEIHGKIVSGTGDFARSTGEATFVGSTNVSSSGSGTYSGKWRPNY